ncbi:MAG TPA: hypothetical protein VGG90_11520 [Candidatus Dormibacteraeota bacterium]
MQIRQATAMIAIAVLLMSCGRPAGKEASAAASSGRTDAASPARTDAGGDSAASSARTWPTQPDTSGLSCVLPVALTSPPVGGQGQPDRGGFLDLAKATLAADPAGDTRRTSNPNVFETVAKPTLRGTDFSVSYDRPFARWVPSPSALIKADGSAYTYALWTSTSVGPGTPTQIHVVDVASGTDRVVYSGGSTDYPVAFANEGIYLVTGRWENSTVGLRALDPASGAIRTIDATGAWGTVSGGYAWGFSGEYSGLGAVVGRIDRLDLATGQVTTWLSLPDGMSGWVAGFDSHGTPVVYSQPADGGWTPAPSYAALFSPEVAHRLFAVSQDAQLMIGFAADATGLWFAGRSGIYLYGDKGLRLVYSTPTQAGQAAPVAEIAGSCS